MARWWNRMPQFDGLFDYQNQVRPTYFAFKLLSRLAGQKLRVNSSAPSVHALASQDPELRMHNLLLWNFSKSPAALELKLTSLPRDMRARHIVLDASTASSDENARLRPEPFFQIPKGDRQLELQLEPYSVHYWSFE
jgi:hypothetical protein